MNEIPIFFKRTRIAPTPSGFLHLGNILSFAITVDMARRSGAKILLRIDDLDRDRVDPAYVQDIFETLQFLEIPWDEGPRSVKEFEQEYSQLHRMNMYREALQQLRDSGKVFACTCSRAQLSRLGAEGGYPGTCYDKGLDLEGPNTAWRLRTDGATLPPSMQSFIVRKKDGFPAYQLTSVLDDLYYGVDLIVRGEDLLSSTAAQHYLAAVLKKDAFGKIVFHHHPLLMATSGEKLSKSAGATSIQYLRRQGMTPADIYTLIARNVGTDRNLSGGQKDDFFGETGRVSNWQELVSLL